MRILITLFIAQILFNYSAEAQYIISTNPKCIAALEEKSQKSDPSLNAAISFIETAKNGAYYQWHSLLSHEYNNEAQRVKTSEWWHYLSSGILQYDLIAEQRVNSSEDKIIFFKSQMNGDKEKILKIKVVKENNEWKVQSVEL